MSKITSAVSALHALRDLEESTATLLLKEAIVYEALNGNVSLCRDIDRATGKVTLHSISSANDVEWDADEVAAAAEALGLRTERSRDTRYPRLDVFFLPQEILQEPVIEPTPPPEKPFPSPQEFKKVIVSSLPSRVTEIFTALMVEGVNASGRGSVLWGDFHRALEMEFGKNYPRHYCNSVGLALRDSGWNVALDVPGYNENYEPRYNISPISSCTPRT